MTHRKLRMGAAALFASVAVFLTIACGGETLPGQHEGCTKQADCPTGNNLTCLTLSPNKSCEVVCDPKAQTPCPLSQTCTQYYGTFICYEVAA